MFDLNRYLRHLSRRMDSLACRLDYLEVDCRSGQFEFPFQHDCDKREQPMSLAFLLQPTPDRVLDCRLRTTFALSGNFSS